MGEFLVEVRAVRVSISTVLIHSITLSPSSASLRLGSLFLGDLHFSFQPINLFPRDSAASRFMAEILYLAERRVEFIVDHPDLGLDGSKVVGEGLEAVMEVTKLFLWSLERARRGILDFLLELLKVALMGRWDTAVSGVNLVAVGGGSFSTLALFFLGVEALLGLEVGVGDGGAGVLVVVVVVVLVVALALGGGEFEAKEFDAVGVGGGGGGHTIKVALGEADLVGFETEGAVEFDFELAETVRDADVGGGAFVAVPEVAVAECEGGDVVVDGVVAGAVVEVGAELGMLGGGVRDGIGGIGKGWTYSALRVVDGQGKTVPWP